MGIQKAFQMIEDVRTGDCFRLCPLPFHLGVGT